MKDTHQQPARQGFAAWIASAEWSEHIRNTATLAQAAYCAGFDAGRASVLAHDAPDSTIGPSSAASSGVSR